MPFHPFPVPSGHPPSGRRSRVGSLPRGGRGVVPFTSTPVARCGTLVRTAVLLMLVAAPAAAADQATMAVERSVAVIEANQLTRVGPDCLLFDVEPGPRHLLDVIVREKHDQRCGGDPEIEPTLFTIRIDKAHRIVTTDAGSPDGSFHLLAWPNLPARSHQRP